MQNQDDDLSGVAVFAPRFFAALASAIAAMPLLDRLLSILPPAIQNRDLATVLSLITGYAVIGREFLLRRPTIDERLNMAGAYLKGARLPTGSMMLFTGVVLLIGYAVYGRFVLQQERPRGPLEEVCLLSGYIALFTCLARGLWQMAFREYARRNDPIARKMRELRGKS